MPGRRSSGRLASRDTGDPAPAARTVGRVYDHDLEEVEVLGWEEFIARQWESIFAGYRSRTGLRRICRRWSDLIEIGLGCPQEIADLLVRAQIIERADRNLEGEADALAVLSQMIEVLVDLRTDLLQMGEIGPELCVTLLESHARLLSLVRALAFGQDAGEGLTL
jgi:hypothetical protein